LPHLPSLLHMFGLCPCAYGRSCNCNDDSVLLPGFCILRAAVPFHPFSEMPGPTSFFSFSTSCSFAFSFVALSCHSLVVSPPSGPFIVQSLFRHSQKRFVCRLLCNDVAKMESCFSLFSFFPFSFFCPPLTSSACRPSFVSVFPRTATSNAAC
jgi:hypothetical protein